MSHKHKSLRAKLIVNPSAGEAMNSTSRLAHVVRCLQNHGLKLDVVLVNPKRQATPLAKKAVKEGYQLILAMGGDGTIEAVMNGMIGGKARLGIIPDGTEGNIVKSLCIPADLDQACAVIASNHTRKLDVGQVKVGKHKKSYFFELIAVGLTASLLPSVMEYAENKLASIKDAAVTLMRQDSKPKVHLTLDNQSKIEVDTMLVTVSNTPYFGEHYLIAPDAQLTDGLLDIAVFPGFNKIELLTYLNLATKDGHTYNSKIQYYRAHKIKIETDPVQDVMADGNLLPADKVRIKVRRRVLRVIVPEHAESLPILHDSVAKELPAPVAPVSAVPDLALKPA